MFNNIFQKKMRVTYGYDDVTLIPSYSDLKSRSQADTSMHGYSLPIISSCMDTLGVDIMHEVTNKNIPFIAHRAFKTAKQQYLHFFPNYEIDFKKSNPKNIWFAVGSVQKYKEWIVQLFDFGVRQFCVDMAHGDSKACIDTIKFLKQLFQKKSHLTSILNQTPHIIAGNVATAEGFRRLENAGANGIRIGIASGQICSTAIQTGFGVPILTNIIDSCKARKNKNTWIIADGGIKNTGDIAKAVYFGADFCMIGKLFASTNLASGKCYNKKMQLLKENTNQQPFNTVYPQQFDKKWQIARKIDSQNDSSDNSNKCISNTVKYKEYHGMASRQARSGLLNYASVQGVSGVVSYIGTTESFINDTKLRLQASLSYGGSKNWKQFRKKVKSCMRSNAGIIAADTHLQYTFDK